MPTQTAVYSGRDPWNEETFLQPISLSQRPLDLPVEENAPNASVMNSIDGGTPGYPLMPLCNSLSPKGATVTDARDLGTNPQRPGFS